MKLRTRRDSRLRKKFKNVKRLQGVVLGRKIREERRMWKRTMSKSSRRLDREAIKRGLEYTD